MKPAREISSLEDPDIENILSKVLEVAKIVNMAVDAIKGFRYELEKLVTVDGAPLIPWTPIGPWTPSKLTGFEIILKITSYTVGVIRDLASFILDQCATAAHSVYTLNGQALWTSVKKAADGLAFLSVCYFGALWRLATLFSSSTTTSQPIA